MGAAGDNGWDMWRKLCSDFDSSLAVKDAQIMAEVIAMINLKAKSLQGTRILILKMEEKKRRVKELRGGG